MCSGSSDAISNGLIGERDKGGKKKEKLMVFLLGMFLGIGSSLSG